MSTRTQAAGFILTMAVCLATSAPLFAADAATPPKPPTSYNAITDTKYYAKPELPKLGPAGTIFNDPAFGCPILRVTDEKTHNGDPCMTPASSEQCTFNTDSTLFNIGTAGDRDLVFRFDSKTMKATLLADAPAGIVAWSHHEPNIAYGKDKKRNVVFKYDFATSQTTELLDIDKIAGKKLPRTGALHISATDVISIVYGADKQNKDMFLLVYDTKTKTQHLWNTEEKTVDGKPAPGDAAKFTMHNGTIDETGNYASAVGPGTKDPLIWDIKNGVVYTMSVNPLGHRVMGYGIMINDIHRIIGRTLDQGGYDKPVELMAHPAGEGTFHYDSHLSWNNAQPDIKTPVLLSTEHNYHDDDPKCAYGDEIFAVATDGSKKVWRFAHTRSLVSYEGKPDYNFWDTPRGNVSQDGRFFMFTSNWENSLGKDKLDRPRNDTFIVKLERAQQNP